MQTETVLRCAVCEGESLRVADAANCLKECSDCGYVFDSPRPTVEALVDYYSQEGQYSTWVEAEEAREELWGRRLRKMLPTRRPGNLLDVGAGIGQFLDQARPHFSSVHGTEVSSSAVRIAKEKYGLDLLEGTLDDLVFDRHFDNVTMFHVLEHVPDPAATVARCVTLLRPGGMLYIAVPNELDAVVNRVKGTLARLGVKRYAREGRLGIARIDLTHAGAEVHLSHFNQVTLRLLLERAGLEVVQQGLDPYSVATGRRGILNQLLLRVGEPYSRFTGRNIYDAMWMVARKRA